MVTTVIMRTMMTTPTSTTMRSTTTRITILRTHQQRRPTIESPRAQIWVPIKTTTWEPIEPLNQYQLLAEEVPDAARRANQAQRVLKVHQVNKVHLASLAVPAATVETVRRVPSVIQVRL
jgi:hypothetical protein